MRKPPRKRRTRQHVLADLSVNDVERHVLRCGWTVERMIHDYGIDLEGRAMKTLDLTGKRTTLDELLELAATDSVRILTADGRAFVLEKADDFEKEVALLGKSKKFRLLDKIHPGRLP